MFLEVTVRRNPRLIDAALRLHAEGRLPPNTYVLDLDAIRTNARTLAEAARREGVQLYFMSKQLNRNPQVIAAVAGAGIPRGVAVDIDDARAFREAGVPWATWATWCRSPGRSYRRCFPGGRR